MSTMPFSCNNWAIESLMYCVLAWELHEHHSAARLRWKTKAEGNFPKVTFMTKILMREYKTCIIHVSSLEQVASRTRRRFQLVDEDLKWIKSVDMIGNKNDKAVIKSAIKAADNLKRDILNCTLTWLWKITFIWETSFDADRS